KNLSLDTKISLGKDITFVTPPRFLSPTSATVQVLVGATTPPGTIAAIASNPQGSNKGPGGVLITVPAPTTTPVVKPPIATLPIKYKQPKGTIILDAPCDPDQLKGDCKQPVGLDDETAFVWHES